MMACSLREELRSYQRGIRSKQPVVALITRPSVHRKDRPKIAFQTGIECQKYRFVRSVRTARFTGDLSMPESRVLITRQSHNRPVRLMRRAAELAERADHEEDVDTRERLLRMAQYYIIKAPATLAD
jgi:hypothetical protein